MPLELVSFGLLKLNNPQEFNLYFNNHSRHTFAVFALNNGLSMSVVSRLLGHASTDIIEKVYARFLPETLSIELNRLNGQFDELSL